MTEEKTWANISRFQTYLFNSGDNFKSYEMLGSHKVKIDGVDGWRFAVWAPKAVSVRVVGDFNDWNGYDKMLERIETSGVWYGFFTDIEEGRKRYLEILRQYGLYSDIEKIECFGIPLASVTIYTNINNLNKIKYESKII